MTKWGRRTKTINGNPLTKNTTSLQDGLCGTSVVGVGSPAPGSVLGVGGVVKSLVSAPHHTGRVLVSVRLKAVGRPGVGA